MPPEEPYRTVTSEVPVSSEVAVERSVVSMPVGMSQMILIAIAIFFVALGAIGLIRMGLDSLTTPATTVGPFGMTPLLALLVLGVGALAILGATGRMLSRGMSMLLGPTLIAAGIIVLIQTIARLGTNRADGVLFIASGSAALLGAMLTPAQITEGRSQVVAP